MEDKTQRNGDPQLPRPTAQRLQRPSWRDSRLVVGVLLIALATLGGASLVSHLDDSVEVLAATHSLVPGQPIAAGDVHPVKVHLDGASKTYYRSTRQLPAGQVLREVRSGELLPRSAVGTTAQVGVKAVAVHIDPALAQTLVAGSVVDVWVSTRTDAAGQTRYSDPRLVLQRSIVSRVPRDTNGFGGISTGQDATVHVLVPNEKVGSVIGAVNTEAKITLVPTAGSPLRGQS